MAAALFAGAASSGGGAGVTILGLGCRVDGVLGCVARGRRGRGPARFSSSDLYKAVGAGLLRVAKVAKRFDLRQFVGYLVCCLAASKLEDFLAYRESDTFIRCKRVKVMHKLLLAIACGVQFVAARDLQLNSCVFSGRRRREAVLFHQKSGELLRC